MNLSPLTAISPIDGRYRGKTESLDAYFSEFALIRYRVKVEVEYFIALCELQLPQLSGVSADVFESLRAIYKDFSLEDAQRIKDIESVTNHDVKAVEYFLKEKFDGLKLEDYKEFINNTSNSLSLNYFEFYYTPNSSKIVTKDNPLYFSLNVLPPNNKNYINIFY